MKLNEDEKRIAYQIESTNQAAALNEIYMTWRLAQNQETKDTAESLLKKLRSLPDDECMDVIRDVCAGDLSPSRQGTDGRGNAGGGQAAIRGAKAGRPRHHGPGTV